MSAMYLQNKYTRWYYNIIQRAQTRIISDYTERHHIIPRSLGGSNNKTNLVDLTAREHFVCHWLLTKMVNGQFRYKMWNAFSAMLYWHNHLQHREKITPRKYAIIKDQISKAKSAKFAGANNLMYGKTHSAEARAKISKTHLGRKNTEETKLKCKLSPKHTGPNYKLRGENNAMNLPGVKEKRKEIFNNKYGVSGPTLVPYKCKHCGKEGSGLGNYKRWHGINCKSLKTP